MRTFGDLEVVESCCVFVGVDLAKDVRREVCVVTVDVVELLTLVELEVVVDMSIVVDTVFLVGFVEGELVVKGDDFLVLGVED